MRWKYKTGDFIERPAPAIAKDGTVYIGSNDGCLYAISSKTILNASPWPQFHQNILHTGVQVNQQGLQLFDIRYLRLEGTPTISGLLQLELAMSAAQVPSFDMNINLVFPSSFSSPQISLNNGLVAYYPFNGNANDESGNGLHGTVYGATLITDRFGKANSAYDFDGVSNYINIPDNMLLKMGKSSYSITAWINAKDYRGMRIWSKGSCGDIIGYMLRTEYGYFLSSDLGMRAWFEYVAQDRSPWFGQPGGVRLMKNTWYFIAAVNDRYVGGKIYTNGVLDSVHDAVTNQYDLSNERDATIGCTNGCWGDYIRGEFFNGAIDDVRVYNRALTSAEVMALYQNNSTDIITPTLERTPVNLQSGLVAYYPFNGNANDESGNNHHGTVVGATLTTDRFGKANAAYYFSGNSYIDLPDHRFMNGYCDVTISAWIKDQSEDNEYHQIMGSGDPRGCMDPITLQIKNRKPLNFGFEDTISTANRECDPTRRAFDSVDGNKFSAFEKNSWIFVAITLSTDESSSTRLIYVDGDLVYSSVKNLPVCIKYDLDMSTQIGAIHGTQKWIGSIDDIRIYNRALKEVELKTLYSIMELSIATPILINNKLTIKNGKKTILTTKNLNASDLDGDYYSLLYRIIALRHGWFTYVNNSNTEILSFRQKDIIDELVQFNHDGSKFAPHYNVTVSNAVLTTISTAAFIVFNPVPIFYNNDLTISQGQAVILNNIMLKVGYSDDYISDSSFSFIISDLQHGYFESTINPGISIVSFTQEELSDGIIQFTHDDSEFAPSYKLAIADGSTTTASVSTNITFVRLPVVKNNFLIISQGETLIINNNMLSASSEHTNNASDLIFIISQIRHGHFELMTHPQVAITTFTQQ